MKNNRNLLSIFEVAEWMQITTMQVKELIEVGMPSYGRGTKFYRPAIENWMASNGLAANEETE